MLGLGWQELVMLVVVIVLVAGLFGVGSLGGRAMQPLGQAQERREAQPPTSADLPRLLVIADSEPPGSVPDRSVERPENV